MNESSTSFLIIRVLTAARKTLSSLSSIICEIRKSTLQIYSRGAPPGAGWNANSRSAWCDAQIATGRRRLIVAARDHASELRVSSSNFSWRTLRYEVAGSVAVTKHFQVFPIVQSVAEHVSGSASNANVASHETGMSAPTRPTPSESQAMAFTCVASRRILYGRTCWTTRASIARNMICEFSTSTMYAAANLPRSPRWSSLEALGRSSNQKSRNAKSGARIAIDVEPLNGSMAIAYASRYAPVK